MVRFLKTQRDAQKYTVFFITLSSYMPEPVFFEFFFFFGHSFVWREIPHMRRWLSCYQGKYWMSFGGVMGREGGGGTLYGRESRGRSSRQTPLKDTGVTFNCAFDSRANIKEGF